MALHQIAQMIDAAHEEIRMERDRRALEQFDDAWASRPVIVDNQPMALAFFVPFVLGMLIGGAIVFLGQAVGR